MIEEICYWTICFVPISATTQGRIFGFSEYLTAVALLAVLYTITDTRYKFRIAITPGYLYLSSYFLLAIIGFQSLLSEVWIAEGWWVPVTKWLDYTLWQMIFGLLFLGTFLTWMYYAFIRPPIFGNRNASRYARVLYSYILRGSDDELKVIANELARSAHTLIKYTRRLESRHTVKEVNHITKRAKTQDYAHDILLLIGNRRLCRHIVATSPVTAQSFFDEMTSQKKFDIPIGQFAKNISGEAISQRESFLYVEVEGYISGLLGYLKPVSTAVYGNFRLVESLAVNNMSPLDIDFGEQWKWDYEQWKAYCRATLITIESYLSQGRPSPHAYSLVRSIQDMERAFLDVYKLDGFSSTYDTDIFKRLSVVVDFVKDAVDLINSQTNPPNSTIRVRERIQHDIYDHLANLIFALCLQASSVKSPQDTCWSIHYGTVWSALFTFGEGKAWKIVRHKVRRLLYDEVARLTQFPNYKGSSILGFCLNIMLDTDKPTSDYGREQYALAKAIQRWTSHNYLKLRKDNLDVAESVLIGSISYDIKGKQLVKTYIKGLSKVAPKSYLKLQPIKIAS